MKFANVLTDRSLISRLSVIEYEGALWIVTRWLEHKTEPLRRPARLIRMTGLQFQEIDPEQQGADYMVSQPIPRALFDDRAPRKVPAGFVVLELPPIAFPVSRPN